jgi:crotonobetainyl-CoA:carnitine CoA-transferase CaiB-like acyl-CoA transferase
MEDGLLAAARRFPARRGAIEALADRDEEFRALCADLAEAEAALHRWAAAPSPAREQRCAEYRDLVDSLADEIEAALDAAKGVPLPTARKLPAGGHG